MTQKPKRKIIPVFDRGRSVGTNNATGRLGLSQAGGDPDNQDSHYHARRTSRDSVPPRSVVTAQLMGDPAPGRSALAMSKRST